MVGILIKYLILDCCITNFFNIINNNLHLFHKNKVDDWSIDVGDTFSKIIIYKNNKESLFRDCKIIDNHYEKGCWFILIIYDYCGIKASIWIAYPDIIKMEKSTK